MMKISFRKKPALPIAALLASATVGGMLAYGSITSSAHAESQTASVPTIEVDVAPARATQIREYQAYSGKFEAVDAVEIRPLVSGSITQVHFKDGAIVRKGEPLFTIDPRLYQAAVHEAEGEVDSAQAHYLFAQTDAQRATKLLQQNAISQRDVDAARRIERAAAADLRSAKAKLETAQVNLDYCHIVSPVDGRVSRAELTVGNVVTAGSSAPVLTRVVSVTPIYAAFEVDEQSYLKYLAEHQDRNIPVDLGLADENGFSRHGAIDSIDNRLNGNSGTIRVRARFENPNGTMVPGMFARVKVNGGNPRKAMMVTDEAVATDQDRKYVLVVDDQQHVVYKQVQIGPLYNGLRIIESGISAGDRVIVNGMQRVRPDQLVTARTVAMDPAQVPLSTNR
jgi:multidrug efflux system membrane fusion protein